MSKTIEQLKSQVLTLSGPERAEPAHFLQTSLEPEKVGAEEAWRIEIARCPSSKKTAEARRACLSSNRRR